MECRTPITPIVDVEQNFKRAWATDYWKPGSYVYEHCNNPAFLEQRRKARQDFMNQCAKEGLAYKSYNNKTQ